MKKKLVVIAFISLYSSNVFTACIKPASGIRVWNLAATALDRVNTTESKVGELVAEVNNDFSGTFTVGQNILTKVCNSLTLIEQINTSFDQLIVSLPTTFSKLCIIDSKVDGLTSQVEDLQITIPPETFTALDGLKSTICSKLEQVSDELEQIESTITLLTQTEIDHAITIASNLSALQVDVDLLNSALDALNFNVDLDSCVDVLGLLVDDLDMDVDNLQGTLSNGFAGTFTALDEQLNKACTVESLIDNAGTTASADFSSVFTALEALQEKVCAIESLVDIVSLINARDTICSTDSKIDIALSKICLTQEEILPLSSFADTVISKLELIEMAGFDQACSKIEVVLTLLDVIDSKVDTIESKVCEIDVLNNTSKLEVLDADLMTISSEIDLVDVMTSKLCIISSKLDVELQTVPTLESLIDVILSEALSIDSKVDNLNVQAALLESKLCGLELTELDALLASLQASDSKLDVIIPVAESNVDQLTSIESSLDATGSTLDALGLNTLTSQLCIIEDQASTVESTLDIVGGLIGNLNIGAQELIGDFQETWTILGGIENKVCTAELTLETVTSKLDQDFSIDLSGVFTEIEVILEKECTVDGKVDIALSLVDDFASRQDAVDFSGVFTVLDALLMKVCTVASQVDLLDTNVENQVASCGTPIYTSDLPLTISMPGRYFLAEHIDYAGGGFAITVDMDDVFIDLNGYTLNGVGASAGISIGNGLTNVQVSNGTISNFTGDGIRVVSSSNVIISDMNISDIGARAVSIAIGRQCIARNLNIRAPGTVGVNVENPSGSNNWVKNVSVFDVSGIGLRVDTGNVYLSDCLVKGANVGVQFVDQNRLLCQRLQVMDTTSAGIDLTAAGGAPTVLQCLVSNSGDSGIISGSDESIVMHNSVTSNSSAGVAVPVAGSPANSYIAFNTAVENGTNYDLEAGNPNAQTLLGNFAFNSTAVGDPNNTNYTVANGSDITRKFVTIAQDGSFVDRPKYWHNINMLP